MGKHPYQGIPGHQLWRRSIAEVEPALVDPVVAGKFRITPDDKVATAGSCFAQHIARHLKEAGFNYFVTETAHPIASPALGEKYGYGVFTARYGNVYTTRQLVQTLHRAHGMFTPRENIWEGKGGGVLDPFRPQIQPGGFLSAAELADDREQHFAAIRRAVRELDVLVFTLGLTETWRHLGDGAVFPVCPGVAGGKFDGNAHGFVNLTVADVTADLHEAIAFVRARNPSCKIILTVSPVPLVATALDRSVLVSTAYSKAVLRVAAEEIASRDPAIAYFPSYEIITGAYNRGAYFASDLRSVTEEGVNHVMRLFLKHYTEGMTIHTDSVSVPTEHERSNALRERLDQAIAVVCEEEVLDRAAEPMEAS